MAVIENTFAELSRQYEELKTDFDRLKERSESDHESCHRSGYITLCIDILLPLYDELLRNWANTGSRDIAYFLSDIKKKLDKNDFVIMDRAFLETLYTYRGEDVLVNSVDVIQSFPADKFSRVLKDVFSVGLIDRTDDNKIVKYPKVTLYSHKK